MFEELDENINEAEKGDSVEIFDEADADDAFMDFLKEGDIDVDEI
jgi:hypothetical protein